LNRISVQAFKRSRYPTAIAAGVLLGISFPQTGVAGFAWIAPGLMLLAAWGKRGLESFRIGYVAGLAHYLTSLRWLLLIPVTGFPILGWIALSAYLALYPAAWVWLSSFQISNFKFQISNPDDGAHAWLAAAERLMARGWSGRMLWALSCGASWVALEMLLTRLLGGFPWNLLGVSQHRLLPLIQFASLTGVCGVSFLVVWTSVSLLCAAAAVLGRPNLRSAWMGEIILPFVTIVALFVFGFHRLRQTPAASRELSVTLVQPSIPQTLIWDARENTNRFLQEIELSERALAEKTDLLIWPEGALPQFDQPSYIAITNLIRSHHVWMLFGADDVEPRPAAVGREDYDVYNAAFLFDPQGRHAATYRKRSLVIFGEYIPLEKWLPFIKWFTPIQGSYTPGNRPVQLELRDREAKTSALICFEDVFPQLGREAAAPDTDFLVNLTNDGWFGEGAAQWQHAANAQFRAIENGLPLVRCTNTGLTCWFDPCGRRRDVLTDTLGSIYGPGFMTVKIPLQAPGAQRPPTFYHQHGDWFGWGCTAMAAAATLRAGLGKRRKEAV